MLKTFQKRKIEDAAPRSFGIREKIRQRISRWKLGTVFFAMFGAAVAAESFVPTAQAGLYVPKGLKAPNSSTQRMTAEELDKLTNGATGAPGYEEYGANFYGFTLEKSGNMTSYPPEARKGGTTTYADTVYAGESISLQGVAINFDQDTNAAALMECYGEWYTTPSFQKVSEGAFEYTSLAGQTDPYYGIPILTVDEMPYFEGEIPVTFVGTNLNGELNALAEGANIVFLDLNIVGHEGPTATPTPDPSSTPSPNPTSTPTVTVPTETPTPPPTATETRVPSSTPTNTPTGTQSPSATPTPPPPTSTPTRTPTQTPTGTQAPTSTPTPPPPTSTPTRTPTNTPTGNPPTNTPTRTPTNTPTSNPPTSTPTRTPTRTPTSTPTSTPTQTATPEYEVTDITYTPPVCAQHDNELWAETNAPADQVYWWVGVPGSKAAMVYHGNPAYFGPQAGGALNMYIDLGNDLVADYGEVVSFSSPGSCD